MGPSSACFADFSQSNLNGIQAEGVTGYAVGSNFIFSWIDIYRKMVLTDATGQEIQNGYVSADSATWMDTESWTLNNGSFGYSISNFECQALYCLKITTSSQGGGTLDVRVNAGSGLVQEATGLNAHGATVLDKCYTTEVSILELQNPTTDGWVGSVEYSTNGGAAYTFLTCTNCGVGSSSESIIVDGNANGAGVYPTECLNGDACSFVQAPTPSPTSAPTPPTPAPPSTPTPAPPSTPLLCSSWCAANTQPFSVKVTWAGCNGCTDPSVPT